MKVEFDVRLKSLNEVVFVIQREYKTCREKINYVNRRRREADESDWDKDNRFDETYRRLMELSGSYYEFLDSVGAVVPVVDSSEECSFILDEEIEIDLAGLAKQL